MGTIPILVFVARAATVVPLIAGRCVAVAALCLSSLVLAALAPTPNLAYASEASSPNSTIADVTSRASAVVRPDSSIKARTARGRPRHETPSTPFEPDSVVGELRGIPQSGDTLGDHDAPVTLQYFADLECPICREFDLGALPALVKKYVRTDELKIEYHSLETSTREPEVFETQQVAALAAGRQDKMWYFVELFYHEQGEEDSGYVTESYLRNLGQQVPGLNLARWTSDRNDSALGDEVANDARAANNEGFTGTPSFLIGRRGHRLHKFEYNSLTEPGSFEAAVKRLLGSA
jgi:protein-disulfide isomerase